VRHTATASRTAWPFWAWARAIGGIAVLAILLWQVGTGPFVAGVRRIDGLVAATALGLGVLTTVCSAWRWRLIAAKLGVRLSLPRAVAAYYRSQFLNTTLPGGILGDVHRAVRHGRDIGDVGLGVRAVVVERVAGQAVVVALAVLVLAVYPSPVQAYAMVGGIALAAVALGALLLVRWAPSRGERSVWSDLLLPGRTWLGVVLLSGVVLAGHLATFLVAARTAGATASLLRLAPLTLLALLAMMLPLNIAGWGPREGVAAWAFGAAGLTAGQGVATAVTYGVLALLACLPGAVVLLARAVPHRSRPRPSAPVVPVVPVVPAVQVPAFASGDTHG
jgi:uncharacterized membrane protein YbhN (UPF0104 family)